MATYVPYLTLNDYYPSIQKGQLNKQVLDALNDGMFERQFAESFAISKVNSFLKQMVDLKFEITPTLPFDPLKTYNAHERAVIDFTEWIANKNYLSLDCVVYKGNGYICLNDNMSNEFDESFWQNLGPQYSMYFIDFPYPLFSLDAKQENGEYISGYYVVGDKIWWKGHIYTCLRESITTNQQESIQYSYYSEIPHSNFFPTDNANGYHQWQDDGEYEILASENFPSLPIFGQDLPIWILGDNRDTMLVQAMVDISLYKLHDRISPNNIPELRSRNMASTMEWLKGVQTGGYNTDIVELQPKQGQNFAWGSKPKQKNGYN